MQLRSYQARTLEQVVTRLDAGRSVLVTGPTGLGKGTLAAEIAHVHARKGQVLFLAHRREIVEDLAWRITRRGTQTGVITGRRIRRESQVQCATIQSLLSCKDLPPASLIILDEAHHYAADEWSDVKRLYPDATYVGFTATPWRADGQPLTGLFQDLVVAAHYSELIREGALVPCQVLRPVRHLGIDLSQSPLDAYREHGIGTTMLFVRDTQDAAEQHKAFKAAGTRAAVVTATTTAKDRKRAFADLVCGEIEVLINVYVATEGIDIPRVCTIILARSCGHMSTYLQIVGRALRPHPGKKWARLIDLTGVSHVHGSPTEDRDYSSGETLTDDPDERRGGAGGYERKASNVLNLSLQSFGFEPDEPASIPSAPEEPEWMTIPEAAERYGKYATTLLNWMNTGRLKFFRGPNGIKLCLPTDMEHAIANKPAPKSQQPRPLRKAGRGKKGAPLPRANLHPSGKWHARFCKKSLGYYETEEEALEAGREWLLANPQPIQIPKQPEQRHNRSLRLGATRAPNKPRGVYYVHQRMKWRARTRGNELVGNFSTMEEATAALLAVEPD